MCQRIGNDLPSPPFSPLPLPLSPLFLSLFLSPLLSFLFNLFLYTFIGLSSWLYSNTYNYWVCLPSLFLFIRITYCPPLPYKKYTISKITLRSSVSHGYHVRRQPCPSPHTYTKLRIKIGRRGSVRTALEFAKLLISLDPADPLYMRGVLDYYCMRGKEYMFLLNLFEHAQVDNTPFSIYPNFCYSAALAKFTLETQKGCPPPLFLIPISITFVPFCFIF